MTDFDKSMTDFFPAPQAHDDTSWRLCIISGYDVRLRPGEAEVDLGEGFVPVTEEHRELLPTLDWISKHMGL